MRPLGSIPFTAFSTMRSGSLCTRAVSLIKTFPSDWGIMLGFMEPTYKFQEPLRNAVCMARALLTGVNKPC